MATYTNIYTTPPTTIMGMMCDTCGCMVRDSDRFLHDQWHEQLTFQMAAVVDVMTNESDEEMLRRLLREVMELSERME